MDEQKKYYWASQKFFEKMIDTLIARGGEEWGGELDISDSLTGSDVTDKSDFLVQLKPIYMFLIGKIVTKITNYDETFDPNIPTVNDNNIKIPTSKTVYDFVQASLLALKNDLTSLEFKKVNQLPSTGESKYIYLVPQNEGNIHDVYYWVTDGENSGHFEPMGDTTIDLSDYATVKQLNSSVDGLINMIEEVEESIEKHDGRITALEDCCEQVKPVIEDHEKRIKALEENRPAPPDDPPSDNLEDCTTEQIKWAVENGYAPDLWDVGDRTAFIELNGVVGTVDLTGTAFAFYIIGFDHNTTVESNGKPNMHLQFGKSYVSDSVALVDTHYSKIGVSVTENDFAMFEYGHVPPRSWANSTIRTRCTEFYNVLPTEWQNIITPCTKWTDNVGDGKDLANNVTPTSDNIWLLSEWEVYGTRTYANSKEKDFQEQYAFYINDGNKIKNRHNNANTLCEWWLRSRVSTSTSNTCIVNNSGVINTANVSSLGFSPCFMIA